ncbi:dNA mismatch repair protein MutL [Clostridium sp. CAG:492]|nr:dNA mismatch repair protein MutL [Clostridium sp. CAG:492]
MGNIVLLDDLTINKIAAGEVIERPASVVKELMENSIDAGATNVTVEIKNGGITYIRITDNGKGILPDDMEIAFERHATSKIRSAKDLETVKSMGFRGEALASIAAIAHVELTSRTADSELGYKIVVEGGNIITKEVVGCPKGTTIIVENLFYNTPVRYKFLKKDFTETGYVEDAVTRIALVNPNVSVKLINLNKNIINTNGSGDIKDVVYSIYGKEIAENIIKVDYQYEDMSVVGCIGKPSIAKSNRSNQLFFVNNRFVKDKTLTSAAEQAFKGMLLPGKYGFLILNLEIDPHKLDVNVHPAKLEVRFQEENKVFKLVYHSIKESFMQNNNLTENKEQEKENFINEKNKIELDEFGIPKYQPKETNSNFNMNISAKSTGNLIEDIYNEKLINSMNKTTEENSNNKVQEDNTTSSYKVVEEVNDNEKISYNNEAEPISNNEQNEEQNSSKENNINLDDEFEEMYRKTFGIKPITSEKKVEENKPEYIEKNDEVEIKKADEDVAPILKKDLYISNIKYKFIGIAFSSYIIVEIENELYIINQQSANERIMYEGIKKNYYNDEKDSQMMLLPDIITLTHKQMDIAKDNMELFKKAGFELEEFGDNTIKLSGVPSICINLDTKELFIESLDAINTVARTAKREIEDKFIATIASKVAEKIKKALTFEEVDSLMQKLLVLDQPFSCPQGKSIAIKLSEYEIEKKFSK